MQLQFKNITTKKLNQKETIEPTRQTNGSLYAALIKKTHFKVAKSLNQLSASTKNS